jgi:hypothetical protein
MGYKIPKYRPKTKVQDNLARVWYVSKIQPLRDTYLYSLISEDGKTLSTEPEYNLKKAP